MASVCDCCHGVGQHERGWQVSIYDSDIENLPVNIRLAMTDEMTTLDVLLPDDLNYTLRMTKESAIELAYRILYFYDVTAKEGQP